MPMHFAEKPAAMISAYGSLQLQDSSVSCNKGLQRQHLHLGLGSNWRFCRYEREKGEKRTVLSLRNSASPTREACSTLL